MPGAVSALTFQSNLFSAGDAVSVQLAHRDFDTLLAAVERLKEHHRRVPRRQGRDRFVPARQEGAQARADRPRAGPSG